MTDQPNRVLDSRTRAALDSFCHHQITYCTVNFNIPPPPPFERRIWHYHRADTTLLKRSMCSFPWVQHLNTNQDPNWEVKTFTEHFYEYHGQMLLLCDDSVIFRNILSTAIYPDIWKLANVTPIFKKGDKQFKTIDQYLSFLFVEKSLKKLFSTIFNKHLTTHHFISKNQSGFRPGDSTTNQLIDLVNDIHRAFDSPKISGSLCNIPRYLKGV